MRRPLTAARCPLCGCRRQPETHRTGLRCAGCGEPWTAARYGVEYATLDPVIQALLAGVAFDEVRQETPISVLEEYGL